MSILLLSTGWRRVANLSTVGVCLLACGSDENGQTVGMTICEQDADCLHFFDRPQFLPAHIELLGTSCGYIEAWDTQPLCRCAVRRNVESESNAAGQGSFSYVLYPGNSAQTQGCSEYSNSTGCLYCSSEFPGCEVDDPHSCDDVCQEMVERSDRDAQQVPVVSPRLARCRPEMNICELVTQINDRCYAGAPYASLEPPELDCNLSDDELALHLNDPGVSPCTAVAAQSCTSAEDCPRGLGCNGKVCGPCSDTCSPPTQPQPANVGYCSGDIANACADGESCVEQVCLPTANVTCTSFTDCPTSGEDFGICALSGVTSVGRGNAETRTFCRTNVETRE